jgi:hypothetical protein
MPTSTIFIRTYTADLPWFRWCIASIGKFWAEDSKILVSCEPQDVEEVKGVLGQYCHDRECEVQEWVQWGNGKSYVFQQYNKLIADTLTDSDVIVFMDSDLLINRTIGLADFMDRDGKKIRWFYEPYPSVEHSEPQACKWLNPTWRAMNIKPEHEFMRRHPFIVWRETLEGCRKYLESQHGPLADYLLNIPGQGTEIPFSEFNCLGFYAWVHQGDKYWFINVNEAKEAGDKYYSVGTGIGVNPVDQFHSWTGDVNQARARFEQACENPDYLKQQGEVIREANPHTYFNGPPPDIHGFIPDPILPTLTEDDPKLGDEKPGAAIMEGKSVGYSVGTGIGLVVHTSPADTILIKDEKPDADTLPAS